MRHRRTVVLACALLLGCACIAGPAQAQDVYRWTDAHGREHFSNTPPPDANAQRVKLDAARLQPEIPLTPRGAGRDGHEGLKHAARPVRRGLANKAPRRERSESRAGRNEAQWRAESLRLQAEVERLERELEVAQNANESVHERFSRHSTALLSSESKADRVEDLAKALARAEERLEQFEDRARAAEVPYGWLR